ncbi:MAG: hypothetical protein ACR2NW_07650 [Thermodesulfobacteriota bacterium]
MIFNYLSKRPLLCLLIIGIIILISLPFQKNIDLLQNRGSSFKQKLYFNSSFLDKISLGFDNVLADIYWLRALQFFGGDDISITEKDSKVLYDYFDIITDLDPKFVNAYRFGGSFLAEPIPMGLGNLEAGIELFDKGRKNNPENYRLPMEEAFLYFIYYKDYEKAAELFNEASEKPGLSDFRRASIKGMAGSSLRYSDNRELSKQIWEEIYNTTQSEKRKNFAFKNLRELNSADIEDRLTLSANQYEEKFGKFPENLNNLLETGFLKKIPLDHNGQEFIIIPQIKSIKSSTLLKDSLNENIRLINAKSYRYKHLYDDYPENLNVLKNFINNETTLDFAENPFGEEYDYDPETGEISYKTDLLD